MGIRIVRNFKGEVNAVKEKPDWKKAILYLFALIGIMAVLSVICFVIVRLIWGA